MSKATRARNGTDWHLARDQLGEEGQDPDRITRPAERMGDSRAHTPSIAYREISGPEWDPTLDPLRTNDEVPHTGWLDQISDRETHDLEIDLEN
jgi:hypothetical protein